MQACDVLDFFPSESSLNRFAVGFAVAFEHDPRCGFELGGLMAEIGTGAALMFAGVAGELDAVDGKHLAPDQALAVAQVKDLGKDPDDVVGEGGEVRLGVATQGDEGDVVAADGFDATAGYDALTIGEQHDFEQHGGWIGSGTGCVVVESCIEAG